LDFGSGRTRRRTPSLAPLIDVVFLLLIFFLLAGTFAAPLPFPIQMPVSRSGNPDVTGHLVIYVGEGGQMAFSEGLGTLVEFESGLRERLARGTVESVTIQSDASAPSGVVVDLLRRIEESRVSHVRLLVVPPPSTSLRK